MPQADKKIGKILIIASKMDSLVKSLSINNLILDTVIDAKKAIKIGLQGSRYFKDWTTMQTMAEHSAIEDNRFVSINV